MACEKGNVKKACEKWHVKNGMWKWPLKMACGKKDCGNGM